MIAIVGSGIAGTTLAHLLAARGHQVILYEKGPEYPYPHYPQFEERENLAPYSRELPPDLKWVTLSGHYPAPLNRERNLVVGGTATIWWGIALRMRPEDFQTRSRFGYGTDWPFGYDVLEPYYCAAEELLGVSGSGDDNPFAPPRSRPFPLPPFELSGDDLFLADRLRAKGLLLHTTPQARTRNAYDGRPQCTNFGACFHCPTGARYSPNHHLQKALETGRCRVLADTSVRRVVVDAAGNARALVVRQNGARADEEHGADVFVIAGGVLESVRLLLLSRDERAPDGLGNRGGQLGRHLMFHHLWEGHLDFKEKLYAGRAGFPTAECHQFLVPETRGRHGGIKVELSSTPSLGHHVDLEQTLGWRSGADVLASLAALPSCRKVVLHAESPPSEGKRVTLSRERDRFGDPFAHVHFESSDFDQETYRFGRGVFERLAAAAGARRAELAPFERFESGHHHMGGCRIGRDEQDSVADPFGKVHGTRNLFVVGASNFVSSSPVNPTLTLVAMAMRTADYIHERTH